MANFIVEGDIVKFSKKVSETNTIHVDVEPTFTEGEYSAVAYDNFNYWKERLFPNQFLAEIWAADMLKLWSAQ